MNRLGVVRGESVIDITEATRYFDPVSWPPVPGDPLIRSIDAVKEFARLNANGPGVPISSVHLNSPIVSPSKVIGAPLNYQKHVSEILVDPALHHNTNNTSFDGFENPIAKLGLFLKSSSSICGPSGGVNLVHKDRRSDHEVELAVVIGREGREISPNLAMDYVAGYCIGLDMTVRGTEDRSLRKSPDSYTVLGPHFVSADEVETPESLALWIKVNGELRQNSSTSSLIVGIRDLISLASRWYTLYPGDVILTGTPDGVAPVQAGDEMEAWIENIGHMRVAVR